MKRKQKYDYKKTLEKGLFLIIYAGIGLFISRITKIDDTTSVIITTTILKMIENLIKHKYMR